MLPLGRQRRGTCIACGRNVAVTQHHLTPVSTHGIAQGKVYLCPRCHKKLHRNYSNHELATKYNTLETFLPVAKILPSLKPEYADKTHISKPPLSCTNFRRYGGATH